MRLSIIYSERTGIPAFPAKAGGAGTWYFVRRGEDSYAKCIMEGIFFTLRVAAAMRRGDTGVVSTVSELLQFEWFQSRTFRQDADILLNALTAALLGESGCSALLLLFLHLVGDVSMAHLLKSLTDLDGLKTITSCFGATLSMSLDVLDS